jgi:hypothetical protein
LRGSQNLKRRIMALRADGTLSRDDELKLNNQLRTLMAAKTSEATSTVAMSFTQASKTIEKALPPEMRGEATRALFYKVDEEMQSGRDYTREEEKALYAKHARTIVDEMNQARRNKTLDIVANANAESSKIKEDDAEAQKFLTSKGYTMDDVRETAKNHGMTEKQVIEHLKKQAK